MLSKQEQDCKQASKYLWITWILIEVIASMLPDSFPVNVLAVSTVLLTSALFCTWRWRWWVRNRQKAELLAEAMRKGRP
jgi:hypothetical protein